MSPYGSSTKIVRARNFGTTPPRTSSKTRSAAKMDKHFVSRLRDFQCWKSNVARQRGSATHLIRNLHV